MPPRALGSARLVLGTAGCRLRAGGYLLEGHGSPWLAPPRPAWRARAPKRETYPRLYAAALGQQRTGDDGAPNGAGRQAGSHDSGAARCRALPSGCDQHRPSGAVAARFTTSSRRCGGDCVPLLLGPVQPPQRRRQRRQLCSAAGSDENVAPKAAAASAAAIKEKPKKKARKEVTAELAAEHSKLPLVQRVHARIVAFPGNAWTWALSRVADIRQDPKVVLKWTVGGYKIVKHFIHHTWVGAKLLVTETRVASRIVVRLLQVRACKL